MTPEEQINILMVDDSATNLLALQSILSAPDRNLVSASSGNEALRYLLDHEAAVILMDVYMPGIDGLETAEMIRGREKSRNIPIIFLTADSTGGRHLSRGYSLGAVDYIVKPIEADILRSKVAVFVELFKKTQQVERQAKLLEEKNLELENANLARLGMLIDLGQELTAEHDPARLLESFCRSARQIVGAQEAGVGLINCDDESLRYFFRSGPNGDGAHNSGLPGVAQRALKILTKEARTLRLNESDALLYGGTGDLIHSFLGAPILSNAKVCGWVYLLNKLNDSAFTEADERLAATLAIQVATAYENAQLYTDAQRHADELQLEIAERKQAEEERAQLLISERAARAQAEEVNRTKDEFLATLSHELRTPLTAILGWSHLVRTGKLEEDQLTRAVETIERNARSQSQLIDDLLDVSRIITGKLQIEPRAVDLRGVIEAAVEAVRPSFEAKKIRFETLIDEQACLVSGDPNRLQQIFWNLLSNAVKFTPAEGKVRIELKRCEPRIRISVADSGIGINRDFVPYIFDRFRQADGSTTRAHGGLGLGLSIVKHLVQLHEGSIEVESDGENRGATFTVSFPIVSRTTANVLTQYAVEPESNGSDAEFSRILEGLRILVVDDEADAREVLSVILTRCGGEVKCCESTSEALKAFREWKPDLLVSDIGLPVEDGYTLIRKLRKQRSKAAKNVPAIALTAYATKEDKARALEAGFQIHVPKPIEPGGLVRSIATIMGRKK
jgi:signal transduction histidine kinase/DNA-binding response OmpR family regulator